MILVNTDEIVAQTNQSFRLSILGGNGFGTKTKISNSNTNTLQPYQLGIGIRAQYIFKSNLSLGILFVAHEGESATINTSQYPFLLTFKTRMQYQGIEIGYWLPFEQTYFIHPHIGVGLGKPKGNFSAEASAINEPYDVVTVSNSGLRPYVSPALSFIADITDYFFVGLEINYLALSDYKNANAVSTFLTIGINISGIH